MGAVDPKDMTASEMLRWAANGEPYNNGTDENNWRHPVVKIGALIEAVTGEWPSEHRVFNSLADKIDAEIEAARSNHLAELVESCIEMHGYTSRHEGERFDRWIERCFIPRPRYEDDEPVDESDFGEDACLTVFGNGDWKIGNRYGGVIEMGSCRMRAQRPAAPDTQERIDGDSQKTADAYWGCIDVSCEDCPAKIDDKRPWERCYARNCQQAQLLDLLRRQRELDACKGGE